MAENHEPGKWDAVVCSGFAAVNVLSSTNVEELGWDYTEMELDPTGTCGLFDGMLLDWDDDTPEERREHEEFFPDAFTVGARILADDWDHGHRGARRAPDHPVRGTRGMPRGSARLQPEDGRPPSRTRAGRHGRAR